MRNQIMQILKDDVLNPEGPVLMPDGTWAIVEMNRGTVCLIRADGSSKQEIANTGRPNGLALAQDGALWVAESKVPSLLRLELSGRVTTVYTRVAGIDLVWPNDICFGPDGMLYMTDSGVSLDAVNSMASPGDFYHLPMDGKVFRIDPRTGEGSLIDHGLRFVNGIAFGPQAEHLYVNETVTGNIYRYRFDPTGAMGEREYFGNVMIIPPEEHGGVAGPDGMAFARSGNLYVCVLDQGDLTILRPDGTVADHIALDGTFPTNIAFGKPGTTTAVVTEGTKNQLILLNGCEEGLPLYTG
jgi:gluconolactonase